MKIFVYEFVSCGGFLREPAAPVPSESLCAEGFAMWAAIVEDFKAIDDVEIFSIQDGRLDLPCDEFPSVADKAQAEREFWRHCEASDFTLLIAPELDDLLLRDALSLDQRGKPRLGCSRDFIFATSSKNRLAKLLCDRDPNFPIPRGKHIASLDELAFPLVRKPDKGAGSEGVSLIKAASRLQVGVGEEWRFEEFCVGIPCGQSFLCRGEREPIPLPLMVQHREINEAGEFSYLGGERSTNRSFQDRATCVGRRALELLPSTFGYVGMDIVLGKASDGSEDYLIEINPRLTTSYVGLRHLTRDNIANAILDIRLGKSPQLNFGTNPIRFSTDGSIT